MNKNNEQKTKDEKLCYYHEVFHETYDCDYCGKNRECLSKECCYAFHTLTRTNDEKRRKLNRVVNNYREGLLKDNLCMIDKYDIKMVNIFVNRFIDTLTEICKVDSSKIYPNFIENVFLLMNYSQLKDVLNRHLTISAYHNGNWSSTSYKDALEKLYNYVVYEVVNN